MNKALSCMNQARSTPTGMFAALILGGDLALLATRLLQVPTQFFDGPMFWLGTEGGYPESYQYLKFGWLAVCFILLAFNSGIRRFAVWSLVFAYLLIDDAATIHEEAGEAISTVLPSDLMSASRTDAVGELLFMALVAVGILSVVGGAMASGPRRFRQVSLDLILLVGFIAVFGTALDVSHALLDPDSDQILSYFFEFAEDGGEMIATSLLLTYGFHVLINNANMDNHLHPYLSQLFHRPKNDDEEHHS